VQFPYFVSMFDDNIDFGISVIAADKTRVSDDCLYIQAILAVQIRYYRRRFADVVCLLRMLLRTAIEHRVGNNLFIWSASESSHGILYLRGTVYQRVSIYIVYDK